MSSWPMLLIGLLAATNSPAAHARAPGDGQSEESANTYRILRKIPVPGVGGYDYLYLDEGAQRLYVAHGTEVAALDPNTGTVIGVMAGLAGVHGIALVPEVGKGFITNGKSNKITVFDPKTLRATAQIASTGQRPDALTYDPASRQLFVFNHSSGEATVIDPGTNKVTATIRVGGALEFARADGKGAVWVNVEDRNEIVLLDSKKMSVAGRFPLAPCDGPTGLALDATHDRLFVGCSNKRMAVVDANTGKVVATHAIGLGVDGTEFDAATGEIFNACGNDGTLWVFHQDAADAYHLVQKLSTQIGARTLVLDPSSHRIFLVAAQPGDTSSASVAAPKPRTMLVPGTLVVLVVGR